MSRIRNRNTKPERVVRSLLHRLGYRFTVNGPLNRNLPGRPDIVLPKYRAVVFVHGCFWHRHEGCPETTTPKTRTQWWLQKFEGNIARDTHNQKALRDAGWNAVVIWECEAAKPSGIEQKVQRLLEKILQYPVVENKGCTALAAETAPHYGNGVASPKQRRGG